MSQTHPSLELQQQALALLRQKNAPRKRWQQLCRFIDSLNQAQREHLVPFLDQRLRRGEVELPDEVRNLPGNWAGLYLEGRACPELALCRGINLQKPRLNSKSLIQLLKAPAWTEIYSIKLFGHDLDDEGLRYLSLSTIAPHVTRLNLTSNRIGNAGLRALGEAPENTLGEGGRLSALESLFLGRNCIDDEGAQWLLQQAPPRRWKLLDLRENEISPNLHRPLQEHFSQAGIELRILPAQSENADPPLRRRKGRSRWSPKNGEPKN